MSWMYLITLLSEILFMIYLVGIGILKLLWAENDLLMNILFTTMYVVYFIKMGY